MSQNPTPSALFVSRIVAGSGISVSPEGGTGIVTVEVEGQENPTEIVGGATPFPIVGAPAASATAAGGAVAIEGAAGGTTSGAGGAVSLTGGAGTAGNATGGVASVVGGAGEGTANGAAADVIGGASGAGVTGNGGPANVAGGAAESTNGNGAPANVSGGAGAGTGNGGDVVLVGGAAPGSGVAGNIVERSIKIVSQGAPTAATVSATLTALQVLAGIITVLQGGAAPSAQQLPLATAMDTALPNSVANDAFDFSVINISTVEAESASITTNTGWTLVGDMDVAANSAATTKSAGRFRARKTAAGAWTLYRLS